MNNPSVKGYACAICGRAAISFCHIEHRGMGGDPTDERTDGFPSCGFDHNDADTCHGAVGKHHMTVRRADDGTLRFSANAVYAAKLRRRGIRVHDGTLHVAQYEWTPLDEMPDAPADCSDDDAPDLTDEAAFLAEYRTADGRNWREAAERMEAARAKWQATGKGWRGRFRDWARDQEVSDAERSRMLKVVDTLRSDDARSLTAQKQRQLADAVTGGAEYAEALSAALTLSASDFAAEFLAREVPQPRRLQCPSCSYADIASEFVRKEIE